MVVFFVTRGERQTLAEFFDSWGSRLASTVELVHYEELCRLGELPGAAAYVFTDLERLTPAGLQAVGELADALGALPHAPRIVNHPRDVLLRYELLRTLHERGLNSHRPHRAPPVPSDARYPVFLRSEHEHRVMTRLLRSQRDVERRLIRAHVQGYDLSALLVVEYQDVADEEGMFHRHTSYVVGDTIVPGYLAFGSRWVVKGGPFLDGDRLSRQLASVLSPEHEPLLREVAKLAGVGYGRFDYAVADGRVHIWELNTNPTLLLRPEEHSDFALEQVRPVADRLTEAFERLAGTDEPRPPVEVPVPSGELVVRQLQRRDGAPNIVTRAAEILAAHALWLTRRRSILEETAETAPLQELP
jgi:hypothetical protein